MALAGYENAKLFTTGESTRYNTDLNLQKYGYLDVCN